MLCAGDLQRRHHVGVVGEHRRCRSGRRRHRRSAGSMRRRTPTRRRTACRRPAHQVDHVVGRVAVLHVDLAPGVLLERLHPAVLGVARPRDQAQRALARPDRRRCSAARAPARRWCWSTLLLLHASATSAHHRSRRRAVAPPFVMRSPPPCSSVALGAARRLHQPVVAPAPHQAHGTSAHLERFHRARRRGSAAITTKRPSQIELDDVPRHRTEVYDFADVPGCRATIGRRPRRASRSTIEIFSGPDRERVRIARDRAAISPARTFETPTKPATNPVAGRSYTSAGVPSCSIRAVVEHGEAIAHRERLLLVVGHVDEGDADLLLDVLQLDLHLVTELEVERAERLVEQQHLRAHHERARERDPLPLPAGELRGLAVAVLGERAPSRGRRRPVVAARLGAPSAP